MAVYLIQAGEDGPVKIGVAEDVPARFSELQVGNHLELRLLRVLPGSLPEERWLHRRYAGQRLRGEWFVFHHSMLTVELPAIECSPGAGIIDALGGAAKVSQITGASRTAVCNWRHNGIPAKFWIALLDEAEVAGVSDVTRETVAWRPARQPVSADASA